MFNNEQSPPKKNQKKPKKTKKKTKKSKRRELYDFFPPSTGIVSSQISEKKPKQPKQLKSALKMDQIYFMYAWIKNKKTI